MSTEIDITEDCLVVYTVIMGDDYVLPRANPKPGVDYICFTNKKNIEPNNWKIKVVRPLFPEDLPRSSREQKIRPHRHLEAYSRSIYIDSTVDLIGDPLQLWGFLISSAHVVFGAMHHSGRDTVRDEFHAVLKCEFDTEFTLAEQFKSYEKVAPHVLDLKPVWGGLIARRHNTAECIEAMEQWFARVLRYSRRDQLSLPLVLAELSSNLVEIKQCSINKSEYHRWPSKNRNQRRPSYYFDHLKQPIGDKAIRKGKIQSYMLNIKNLVKNTLNRLPSHRWCIAHESNEPWWGIMDIRDAQKHNVRLGFDKDSELFYAEKISGHSRVYVSAKKRLDLYMKGLDHRLAWLLGDYGLPEDLIRSGDTIIDIGANNGELGIWSLALGGCYVGFEPDPNAFKVLKKNVDSPYLFDAALSDSNATSEFYLSTNDADSSLFHPSEYTEKIKVNQVTLDSFLVNLNIPDKIRLLKIEAEGMEPEVIAGALKTLSRVEYIAVDAGPERAGINTAPDVLNVLFDNQFSIISCYLRRGTFLLKRKEDTLPETPTSIPAQDMQVAGVHGR